LKPAIRIALQLVGHEIREPAEFITNSDAGGYFQGGGAPSSPPPPSTT
jgi:hypothetical protein